MTMLLAGALDAFLCCSLSYSLCGRWRKGTLVCIGSCHLHRVGLTSEHSPNAPAKGWQKDEVYERIGDGITDVQEDAGELTRRVELVLCDAHATDEEVDDVIADGEDEDDRDGDGALGDAQRRDGQAVGGA